MTVIALHGDFSSGANFQRDAGNPDWVDHWPDWKKMDLQGFLEGHFESLVFVAYSRGGSEVADLMNVEAIRKKTKALVLYESPIMKRSPPIGLEIPLLMIWNDYEPGRRRLLMLGIGSDKPSRRAKDKAFSIATWAECTHPVTYIQGGIHSHTKRVPYWPFIGHGWDIGLNAFIGNWLKHV